jgi:molecular chaperone DnaJ
MVMQQVITCPVCHGPGTIIDDPCPECAGSGTVRTQQSLRVRIPAGIEDGTALRVAGRGMPSPESQGADSDLFVIVRTAPDERFERRGPHLHRTESVSIVDAVLGTTLRVPTLGPPVRVKLKPGTQPGTVLRVAGKGLPAFEGTGRGDLYLRIDVRIPEALSAEERALYEQLRGLSAPDTHDGPAPAAVSAPRRRWRWRRLRR